MWPGDHGGEGPLPQFTGLRRVGDSSTLIIPLDTITCCRRLPPSDSGIDYSQFDVSMFDPVDEREEWLAQDRLPPDYDRNVVPPTAFINVEGEVVNSPALRHPIVASDPSWEILLRERLTQWAWVQWYQLADHRPELGPDAVPFQSDLVLPENFVFPDSWCCADAFIPEWYHEWEKGRMTE